MAHTVRDKEKLLNRARRIRGQIEAIERALDREDDCFLILQTIASVRGAMNGLMAMIVEGHIRLHLLNATRKPTPGQSRAADELIDVVKAFLK